MAEAYRSVVLLLQVWREISANSTWMFAVDQLG